MPGLGQRGEEKEAYSGGPGRASGLEEKDRTPDPSPRPCRRLHPPWAARLCPRGGPRPGASQPLCAQRPCGPEPSPCPEAKAWRGGARRTGRGQEGAERAARGGTRRTGRAGPRLRRGWAAGSSSGAPRGSTGRGLVSRLLKSCKTSVGHLARGGHGTGSLAGRSGHFADRPHRGNVPARRHALCSLPPRPRQHSAPFQLLSGT